MLTHHALVDLFSGKFEKDGSYPSTLMGGVRYALFARDAEGVVKKVGRAPTTSLEREVQKILKGA